MANYKGTGRSSYALMKDSAAFVAWCEKYDVELITDIVDGVELQGFMQRGEVLLPNSMWDDELQDDVEVRPVPELAALLADGWAIEFRETGHEKMRYLGGWSTILFPDGRMESIDLDDLSARVRKAAPDLKLTLCEH